jgi:hypothetical protein
VTTKTIEIHYLVCVPLNVEVDDDGKTTKILEAKRPYIDVEGFIGVDEHGGKGEVWEPDLSIWREATDEEYDAGTNYIKIYADCGGGTTPGVLDAIFPKEHQSIPPTPTEEGDE